MLTIRIRDGEVFDEEKQEFVDGPIIATLELEHSLVSLSKWESKFEKPFLGVGEKSDQEVLGYIEAMVLNPTFSPEVLSELSQQNLDEINNYINAKMTATIFRDDRSSRSREVITSELIYYWMISFNIPFECQHWHLNRLFTLIRFCDVKQDKPKKMGRQEMLAERRRLNDERRAALGTRG